MVTSEEDGYQRKWDVDRSSVRSRAGPKRCGVQCQTWARGPLTIDFMTSSCSVNRVTIVVERRYTVQH